MIRGLVKEEAVSVATSIVSLGSGPHITVQILKRGSFWLRREWNLHVLGRQGPRFLIMPQICQTEPRTFLAGWGHFGNSRTMIVIYWFAPRLGFDFRSSPVTIFGNNFKILFLTTFLNNYNIVYNVWKFKIIFYTLKYVLKINNIINF